ncbi:hypothetical protein F4809DRAFT_544649 [Biscogniauxia mediterranea]|nr:hypothetical protein F4809DRAFT_544649 [Biscogniauxia mediterranea]
MGLPKITIMAAPSKKSAAATQQSSDIITVLGPAVELVLRGQQFLGATSILFLFKIPYDVLRHLLASQIVASQLILTSIRFLSTISTALKRIGSAAWNAKRTRRFRKKLEFEFFTLILSSGGNCLCLMMFWPGWWILGITGLMLWKWTC